MFDKDKSGAIDANELSAVLQTFNAAIPKQGSEEEAKMVKEIMETVDINQDGVIDFEEFCTMMQKIVSTEAPVEAKEPEAEEKK